MSDVAVGRLPFGRLLVLAGAVFSTMSTQFLPTGLMAEISADLDVSEPLVGQLLTVFSLTVVVTAAPLTLLTRRFSRKRLLVLVLVLFAATNVLSAFAPNYETLLIGRVVTGVLHGLVWAVAIPFTGLLVHRTQIARGMVVTNSGATFAFLLGVPLTAAVGHATSWRVAFVVLGVVILGLALLTAIALPSPAQQPVRSVSGALPTPAPRDRTLLAVLIGAGATLFIGAGHNFFYGYVQPWSIDAGVLPSLVSVLLLVCGISGLVGLLITAVFADRWPRRTFLLMTGVMAVSIFALAAFGDGLFLVFALAIPWSIAFGGLPTMFNSRAVHDASPRIRPLSGAIIATAFNAAIAFGALLGGLVFDTLGIAAVPWFAGGIVAVGFFWVLLTDPVRMTHSFGHSQQRSSAASSPAE